MGINYDRVLYYHAWRITWTDNDVGLLSCRSIHSPCVLFFRGKTWWCLLGQLACLFVIHGEMLGGLVYELPVFGKTVYLHQQSLAVLSLIPIWLYQGKQGHMTRFMKYFNYFFYPAHMLILGLIQLFR